MNFPQNTTQDGSSGVEETPVDQGAPKRPGRRPGVPQAQTQGVGAPAAAGYPGAGGGSTWESKDAENLWPEILSKLPEWGKTPFDVDIRVEAVDPLPQRSFGSVNGANVSGDSTSSPGDMLTRMVDDNFHLPTARTPVRYRLTFVWRQTGRALAVGQLQRPSPDEVIAVRRALYANAQRTAPIGQSVDLSGLSGPPGGGAQGAQAGGCPPGPYGWGPPYGGPPWGYGAPPTAPMGVDPEVVNLRAQVATLTGQIGQVLEYLKIQQQAQSSGLGAPALPAAAPAPQIIMQAPTAPPAPTGLGSVRELIGAMREMRELHNELGSFFTPSTPPEAVEAGPASSDADDKPGLGLHVYPIPETSLKLAKDAKTGNIDWGMTAFSNADSEVGKKVLEIANTAVQSLTKLAGVRDGNILPAPPAAATMGLNGANGTGVGQPVAAGSGWTPN